MNPVVQRTITHVVTAGVVVALFTGCAARTTGPDTLAATGRAGAHHAPGSDPAQLAGCAGGPTDVAPVEVAARLVDGRVDPAPQRVDVERGAPVVLRIEADTPTEVHLHGYDRMAEAAPGAPACIEVVADVPGVYEVEAHPQHTLILQLAVR